MSRCKGQGHVSSVRSSDNSSAFGIDPRVFLEAFETLDVVENVFSAPVLVDPLHVTHTIPSASPNVRNKDRESIKSQVLDERHREPGKIWPLLSLRTLMDVLDKRSRTLVSEFGRRQVEPSRNSQSVKRSVAGIFASRKIFVRNAQDLFAGKTLRHDFLPYRDMIDLRWTVGSREREDVLRLQRFFVLDLPLESQGYAIRYRWISDEYSFDFEWWRRPTVKSSFVGP